MRDGPGTARRGSLKLILSYVFDWVVLVVMAIFAGVLTLIPGNHRAFSLADPDISFPYTVHETISTSTLVLVAVVAPVIITFLIVLIFAPGPTVSKYVPKRLIWNRKLWELNTAWLGLALSVITAFLFTDGMKILFGKPRPDLLSRCQPDLDNLAQYVVGGLGTKVLEGQYLVDWHICQQPDPSILSDGFMSFPSGHNSTSWAGLGYLALFICAKFAISIPYLLPGDYSSSAFMHHNKEPNGSPLAGASAAIPQHRVLRSTAAAPPIYLYVVPIIPVSAAIYIGATRYTDYRHHGFDIIFGTLIGMLSAYLGFYWYHAPIRRGAGWSWGPRSADKAWAVGMGVQAWAGPAEWKRTDEVDLEAGTGAAAEPVREETAGEEATDEARAAR